MIKMEQIPTEPARLSAEVFKCEPLDFSLVSNRSSSSSSPSSSGSEGAMYEPKSSRKVTFSVHLDTPTPSPETYGDSSSKGDRDSPSSFPMHLQKRHQVKGQLSPHAAAPMSHLAGATQRQQHSPNSSAATALSYPGSAIHINPSLTSAAPGSRQMGSPNSMAILQAILESRTHSHASPTSMGHGFQLPNIPGATPFLGQSFGSPNGALNLAAAAAAAGLPTQTPPGFQHYSQAPPAGLLGANHPFLQLPGAPQVPSLPNSLASSSPPPMNGLNNMMNGSQKRRPPGKTPEDKKDQAYMEKRAKNNLAAKRSRDAKRMKEEATAIEASKLSIENQQLKNELYASNIELARTKLLLQTLSAQHPQIASSLQQLPNSPLSISLSPPSGANGLTLPQSLTQTLPQSLSQTSLPPPQQQPQTPTQVPPSSLSPVLSSLQAPFHQPPPPPPAIHEPQPNQHQLAAFLAENAAALASAHPPAAAALNSAPNGAHPNTTDPAVLGFLLQFFLENQQAGK